MKKVRVLHIITRLDPGGSAVNTLETVARLDSRRYHVDLLSGRTQDNASALEFIKVRGLRCVFLDSLGRDPHILRDCRAIFELFIFIRKGRYDIVHTHSSKAGILGRWAAYLAGVKYIVHTPHGHVFYGYFSRPVAWVYACLERVTAGITSRLIALTSKGIAEHRAWGVGREGQWVAIPSGIDMAVFRPSPERRRMSRQALGLGDDEIVFISVGRLESIKNQTVLIEAFAMLAKDGFKGRLVIVGEGPDREVLQSGAQTLGVGERVIFTGFRSDISDCLNAADIFLLASLNEGMGRAAVEAMATGLPLIVSRAGGLTDLVEDGQQGFSIAPDDINGWAHAMRTLAADASLRAQMAEKSRQSVIDRFSIETMVKQIEAVYLKFAS